MAKLAIVVLCAVMAIANANMSDYGTKMSIKAFDAICWWEGLKSYPEQTGKYINCQGQAQSLRNQITNTDEPSIQKYFGEWLPSMTMPSLPSQYAEKCNTFLKNPNAAPPSDESDALNDGSKPGEKYPFQGFAYCLIKTLRDSRGQKAVDDVKNEKTHSLKHWRSTILDRDNEYRARHGEDKFVMIKALNDAAQAWAEEMASKCKMYHSENEADIRKWKGKGTGESIYSSGARDIAEDMGYSAANSWYSEVKNYPYPDAYTGQPLPGAIGHFTQTVWKETKYVGYGYKYNKDCPKYQGYVAARYSPAANLPGAYGANVPPIKS